MHAGEVARLRSDGDNLAEILPGETHSGGLICRAVKPKLTGHTLIHQSYGISVLPDATAINPIVDPLSKNKKQKKKKQKK